MYPENLAKILISVCKIVGTCAVATVTLFYYLSVLSYLTLASDLIFLRLRAYYFFIVMIPL